MSDEQSQATTKNKRYYWLKLQEYFFNQDEFLQLEDNYDAILGQCCAYFYIKLCSCATENGVISKVVGSKIIPYNEKSLSKLTNTPIKVIKFSLDILLELGLIYYDNHGAIILPHINEMVGSETESTRRSRKSRMLQCNDDATLVQHQSNHILDKEEEEDKKKDINTDKKEKQASKIDKKTFNNKEAYFHQDISWLPIYEEMFEMMKQDFNKHKLTIEEVFDEAIGLAKHDVINPDYYYYQLTIEIISYALMRRFPNQNKTPKGHLITPLDSIRKMQDLKRQLDVCKRGNFIESIRKSIKSYYCEIYFLDGEDYDYQRFMQKIDISDNESPNLAHKDYSERNIVNQEHGTNGNNIIDFIDKLNNLDTAQEDIINKTKGTENV